MSKPTLSLLIVSALALLSGCVNVKYMCEWYAYNISYISTWRVCVDNPNWPNYCFEKAKCEQLYNPQPTQDAKTK